MILYWFEKWCCDIDEIELLIQMWIICSRKTKNLIIKSILRSCKIEFSNDYFDLKIKWINFKWRCKLLLNVKISWQKRQIWKNRCCFDVNIWQCEIFAIWLIETNLIDVELKLIVKMSNLIFDEKQKKNVFWYDIKIDFFDFFNEHNEKIIHN